MAIVTRVFKNISDERFFSDKLYRSTIASWGKDPDETYELSLANAPKLFPPKLDADCAPLDSPNSKGSLDPMNPSYALKFSHTYKLTTIELNYGAAAIFYPGVMKRIYEIFKEEYYVLPYSIHYLILHPMSRVNYLAGIKAELRKDASLNKKCLSRTVYKYDMSKNELVVAN
jgi:hypothetical protein